MAAGGLAGAAFNAAKEAGARRLHRRADPVSPTWPGWWKTRSPNCRPRRAANAARMSLIACMDGPTGAAPARRRDRWSSEDEPVDVTTSAAAGRRCLYTLVAFVVALSIIVAMHEYGHYIVGRWSGIQAEVFSLGFGPVLFSRTRPARHALAGRGAALRRLREVPGRRQCRQRPGRHHEVAEHDCAPHDARRAALGARGDGGGGAGVQLHPRDR